MTGKSAVSDEGRKKTPPGATRSSNKGGEKYSLLREGLSPKSLPSPVKGSSTGRRGRIEERAAILTQIFGGRGKLYFISGGLITLWGEKCGIPDKKIGVESSL